MLLSHSRRFIFIHVYKVAGTSVRDALAPYAHRAGHVLTNRLRRRVGLSMVDPLASLGDHPTALDVRSVLGKRTFDRYTKFAFVRNPWDWQVSLYYYMRGLPTHPQHKLIMSMRDFTDYIVWRCTQEPRSQRRFLDDEQGNSLMDFVGRFETLSADFARVCQQLGLECTLGHANASKRARDYRSYYTDLTRTLVADTFRADIERFGYTFEGASAGETHSTSPAARAPLSTAASTG